MIYCQVKVRLDKVQEDGSLKQVSEVYLVETAYFGVAESTVQEEIAPTASGDFDIVAIARKSYEEIIASKLGEEISDRWYKCKVNLITLNERNGREVKTPSYFLVQSASALTAHKAVDEFMSDSISEYDVEQVEETKILEVFGVKQ